MWQAVTLKKNYNNLVKCPQNCSMFVINPLLVIFFIFCLNFILAVYIYIYMNEPKTAKTASILNWIETNKVKTRTLFNKTRQYIIHIFNKIIFFKYRTT